MLGISFSHFVKEWGAVLVTTALSCGPSQLFGAIKLVVDTRLLLYHTKRKTNLHHKIKRLESDGWDHFKATGAAAFIAKKLGIEQDNLTQESVKKYLAAKNRKIEEKVSRLYRSIKADACALIPLVGAHLSWRIATEYRGKKFSLIFSRGVQQLFENFQKFASLPLFMGRLWTTQLPSYGDIHVRTSTKYRKLDVRYEYGYKLNDRGDFEKGTFNSSDIKKPMVVLFHPNMGDGGAMVKSAQYYRDLGYNTLGITIGGYPGSSGVISSEKSMYQDIEALKQYLVTMGVTEVVYHGFSLGSGAAMQAATGESLVTGLKTLFVVLDQPLASAAAVGENVAGPFGKGFMQAACPVGLDVELPGGLWTKTDGLDNLTKSVKLKEQNIPLICIQTDRDYLMGRKKRNGRYVENFAQDLLAARYSNDTERRENLVTLSGRGHGENSLNETESWDNCPIPSLLVKSNQPVRVTYEGFLRKLRLDSKGLRLINYPENTSLRNSA